jgi:signal peptidase I
MPRRSTHLPIPPALARKRQVGPKAPPGNLPGAYQPLGRWALDWAKSLIAGFILFLFVRLFILQTWVITSGSMENTLLTGDLLVLNKVAYGAQLPGNDSKRLPGYTHPKRGDVVVFRAHHDTLDVIKRIVGIPGDTLRMRKKILYLNGQAQTEPYVRFSDPEGKTDGTTGWFSWQMQQVLGDSAYRKNYSPTRDNWGPFVVPSGHYFMMGDNRDDSLDSRFWGFLDESRVKGKAEVIYYSYKRDGLKHFAWLRDIRWSRIGKRIK